MSIATVIADTLLWTGAVVWLLAAVYGLSEIALWLIGITMRSLGIWPHFARALRVYFQERRGERPGA